MEFRADVASTILQLVIAVISALVSIIVIPWMKKTAIPWMKEKRLYSIVQKFVWAAEKRAETGELDSSGKKRYVIQLLESKGYVIDGEVSAFIESAVKELDMAAEVWFEEISDEFEDKDESPNEAPNEDITAKSKEGDA